MPHIPRIDELMASDVDGTIDADERSELQDHLATCAECREELRLARAGREAAGQIADVDVPAGTLRPVIRELDRAAAGEVDDETAGGDEGSWAAGPGGERPRATGVAWRVLVAAAAASLVVLGAIVVVPRGGDDDTSTSTGLEEVSGGGDAADETAPAASRPPGVERSSQDFDQPSLAALAAQTTENPQPSGTAPSQERLQEFAPAIACVEQWAESTQGGVALRVIEATYEGKPAYIGVFRVDTPPAKVVAWAVRQKDCRVLAVTTDRL